MVLTAGGSKEVADPFGRKRKLLGRIMKRILSQKRSILAILAGMLICFLFSVVIKPACFGLFFGIIAACAIAGVSSPKEGAVIGVFVPIPLGIYVMLPGPAYVFRKPNVDLPSVMIGELFSVLFMALVGATIGLIVGKLYEMRRQGKSIIF